MSTNKKRKQYIVDSQQYKVSAIIVLYNIIAIFLTGLLVFLPSIIGLTTAGDSSQEIAAAREILILHKRFWPAIFLVALVIGAHSIFFFHRLFGPLYRFKATMKEVAQGDLSFNFAIRNKDFFTEEKEVMNEMISSLRKIVMELKQDNEVLVESIDQLDSSLDDQEPTMDTVRQSVKEIRKNGEKMSKGLDSFKVS